MLRRFDLFAGSLDAAPLWLEVADGLNSAIARMEQRARVKPGRYFVYDVENQVEVASIDTEANETAPASNDP